MKKCTLFLMCLLALASCTKNNDLQEITPSKNHKQEISVREDFQQLKSTLQDFFSGLTNEEVVGVDQKLRAGLWLEAIDPIFRSDQFNQLEARLFNNLKLLIAQMNPDELEYFIADLDRIEGIIKADNIYGNPCYDEWEQDLAMADADLISCLSNATNRAAAAACMGAYHLMVAKTELDYRTCIENTNYKYPAKFKLAFTNS